MPKVRITVEPAEDGVYSSGAAHDMLALIVRALEDLGFILHTDGAPLNVLHQAEELNLADVENMQEQGITFEVKLKSFQPYKEFHATKKGDQYSVDTEAHAALSKKIAQKIAEEEKEAMKKSMLKGTSYAKPTITLTSLQKAMSNLNMSAEDFKKALTKSNIDFGKIDFDPKV